MLFSHWQAYLLEDHQSFITSCVSTRTHHTHTTHTHTPVTLHLLQTTKKIRRCSSSLAMGPSPGQLLETVFHAPSLHSAWRALRYAEAAKYNGEIKLFQSVNHSYSSTLLSTRNPPSPLSVSFSHPPPESAHSSRQGHLRYSGR